MMKQLRRNSRKRPWLIVCILFLFSIPIYLSQYVVMTGSNSQWKLNLKLTNNDLVSPQAEVKKDRHVSKPLHFIYTIGCGGHSDASWQLLQSTVLDQSFIDVKQRGKLTRLISGCVDDVKSKEKMSKSVLSDLSVKFVKVADEVYAGTEKKRYVQANRPTALQIFFTLPEIIQEDPETVYIVLDPDFVFRKSISEEIFHLIQPGHLVSHHYGLYDPKGYAFQACNEALEIVKTNQLFQYNSSINEFIIGCNRVNTQDSFTKFYAGVPYMLLREDWLKLLNFWIPLIGPVLIRYPGIESDMIAWAIGAVAAGLIPHLRHDFMNTCMSSEEASTKILERQYFLHLCQSYYVPETRLGEQFFVNNVDEIPYIVSKRWLNTKYVFVFNKHWLRRSNLLTDCNVPLLAPPPPKDEQYSSVFLNRYLWHHFVLMEAINAYNHAVVEYRKKFLKDCIAVNPSKGLILHEIHRSKFPDGWNHPIDLE